jgi:16S rRNA (guanine1207-N2)-methyltransferase
MGGRLPTVPQYFDERPEVGSDPRPVEVLLPDISFTMHTDRGVFSHGRLDTGTGLLLRTAAPLPSTGHFLDLGCGAGPIALVMALRAPLATVWAVDVNDRARELCRANAETLELGNVRVARPDEVEPDLRFDRIWSNPPIRIGKQALHELLGVWLDRLAPEGRATLVVQRHLGADALQRWLVARGHAVERSASRAGFRVLEVSALHTGSTGPA